MDGGCQLTDHARIANPKTHYGNGKAATRHFFIQRLSGLANIGFTGFFVWLVVRLAGAGRADLVSVIAHPVVALILALLLIVVGIHMRIGMNDIIHDYVHTPARRHLAEAANTAFVVVVMGIGLLAIAKLLFWG